MKKERDYLQFSYERFDLMQKELSAESDRGCILVAASVIEELLGELVKKRFSYSEHVQKKALEPLLASMGGLSTFSSKIKIVYCLGLVPKWLFEDLESIRKIRNSSAHEYSKQVFETDSIRNVVRLLKSPGYLVMQMEEAKQTRGGQEARPDEEATEVTNHFSKEREWFTLGSVYIAGSLQGLIDRMKSIEPYSYRVYT